MTYVFETPRMRARHWRRSDFDAIHAIYADPVAMRWVGDGLPITVHDMQRWFEVTETNYATRGYGMFALEDRGSGQLIGCCGLVHPGGQAQVEVKYTFLRSVWGRGLASEMLPALLRHGHACHGLDRVIATVDPDNLVSQHLLRKAGARDLAPRLEEDGTTTLVFEWVASTAR